MVQKVIITNNNKTPIRYLPDLENFKNGKEYVFKPGVNIIVGENGCGKTTLLKLIKAYLLVDNTECSRGAYNSNINYLFNNLSSKELLDGVDVYADYERNTFRLCHAGERTGEESMSSFAVFGELITQKQSSTGEGVLIAMNSLFKQMFSKDANLKFDYGQFKEDYYPQYAEYIKKHRAEGDEWTILMDEPDRNLSLDNIKSVEGILSIHKKHTQIICVVHNPLLIYSLSKKKSINFIEMTEGYIEKTINKINEIVRPKADNNRKREKEKHISREC